MGKIFDANENLILNLELSLQEADTGQTWIDGKKIYYKTVALGSMPNNTTKTVKHEIVNVEHFIKMEGVAWSTSGNTMMLPYVNFYTPANSITVYANKTNVELHTGGNNSSYNVGYITLYYTKT